jgi:hypothetical protein
MAYFARINQSGIVQEVIAVDNETLNNLPFPESEPVGVAFLQGLLGADTIWKQTSYNASFRKNYAGIGFVYDSIPDAFIAPKPFPSWLLNTNTYQWQAPVPYPNDGKLYQWNEETLSWVEITGA